VTKEGLHVGPKRVDLKEVDADPLPVTSTQTTLDVDYIWRRRHVLYWETLDPRFLKNTIMNRAYPRS